MNQASLIGCPYYDTAQHRHLLPTTLILQNPRKEEALKSRKGRSSVKDIFYKFKPEQLTTDSMCSTFTLPQYVCHTCACESRIAITLLLFSRSDRRQTDWFLCAWVCRTDMVDIGRDPNTSNATRDSIYAKTKFVRIFRRSFVHLHIKSF